MNPALLKILKGPHSPAVVEVLVQGGWHEGYIPDWEPTRNWSRLYGGDDDHFAHVFLSAFAYVELSFVIVGDTPQDMGEREVELSSTLAADGLDRDMLDRFTQAAGERVFPVGRAQHSYILLLGNKGRFFMTMPGVYDLHCLGEGWDGLLHHLQTGDQTVILKWPGR